MMIKIVLTGPREGATVKLAGITFKDGVGLVTNELGALRYMANCYAAYPEDSAELAQAKEIYAALVKETEDGISDNIGPVSKTEQQPESNVQPTGEGSTETPAVLSGSDDDTETGSEGSIPSGDGHADTGLPEGQTEESGTSSETIEDPVPEENNGNPKLRSALLKIDPTNADLWTTVGDVRMDAVEAVYGDAAITRKQVKAEYPDFSRDEAKKHWKAATEQADDLM